MSEKSQKYYIRKVLDDVQPEVKEIIQALIVWRLGIARRTYYYRLSATPKDAFEFSDSDLETILKILIRFEVLEKDTTKEALIAPPPQPE